VLAFSRKWGYVDADGTILGYHCRQDNGDKKIMWWQLPSGENSQGEIQAASMPLYNLLDLAANPTLPVLICEGEKAADAAVRQGFLAVSFAGGASQKDFGVAPQALAGRDVVLWPDADKPGVEFMQLLQKVLRPIARRVRWLVLPNANSKDDAADYFVGGGTADQLEALVLAADTLGPSLPALQKLWTWQELLRTHFKPPTWILDNLLPEVGLTILGGKPKVGKSWLALQLAGAVGSGDEVLNRHAVRGRVLYFCIEDRAARIKNRGQLQGIADDADVIFTETLEPLDAGGMEVLESLISEVSPSLVVIDTLASAKSGKVDENAAGPMADILNKLQGMAHIRGLSILLVAHHRKGALGDPGADLRGSSAISAAADMLMALIKKPPSFSLNIEGRDTEDAEYRMEFEDYRWKIRGDARLLAKQESEETVLDVLAQLGESDAGTVAREASISRATALRILKELEFKRRIESRTVHVYGDSGTKKVLYKIAGVPRDDVYRGGQ
jgi:hypothetical protein